MSSAHNAIFVEFYLLTQVREGENSSRRKRGRSLFCVGQSGHLFKKLYLLKNIIKTVPFLVSSVVVMFLMFKKEKKSQKQFLTVFPFTRATLRPG